MSFEYERINRESPIRTEKNYLAAVQFRSGASLGSRIIDKERNIEAYVCAVESNRERPPGTYLIFMQDNAYKIDAYKIQTPIGESLICKFLIFQITDLTGSITKDISVNSVSEEMFNAIAISDDFTYLKIEIEYINNFGSTQ